MTPDEARDLIEGTTPGPRGYYSPRGKDGHYDPVFGDVPGDEISLAKRPADWHLIAAAPALASTIAGMTTEYRHEVQSIADGTWHPLTEWAVGEPDRRPWNVTPTRIVRRYVTEPEEA